MSDLFAIVDEINFYYRFLILFYNYMTMILFRNFTKINNVEKI